MKKILLIGLIFLITGCTTKLTSEEILYNNYVSELKQSTKYESNLPFDLEVYVETEDKTFWDRLSEWIAHCFRVKIVVVVTSYNP